MSGLLLFVLLFPLAKRKSGWRICGSSWFGGLVCFVVSFLICLLVWTNCVLVQTSFHSLCSCKDRASERHRPNSRKKIKYFFYCINRIPQPQFSCDRHEDSGHSKSDNGLKFYKVMRLEPNGPETECKQLVYCATLPGG